MRTVFLCVLACVSTAQAEVTLRERVSPYAISGSSAAQLRNQMNARGPRGYDGYTEWHVDWNYRYRESGGQCAIASVDTRLQVSMTLPQWSDESKAAADLRERWQRYFAALKQHENGHREIGMKAANEIDRGIASLGARSSCDALGAAANALGQAVIGRYNQADLDYDRSTDHGKNQGARFP